MLLAPIRLDCYSLPQRGHAPDFVFIPNHLIICQMIFKMKTYILHTLILILELFTPNDKIMHAHEHAFAMTTDVG